MPIITPRVLKGFRDFLPDAEMTRKALIEKLETVFSSFGFVPIDTPVLEYAEILLGKGGGETDKQVYRFKDHGDRDVAMRFDLTVPFARFMAEHVDELYLPFRRYHIAKVWRGENTQRGRYREFMQCDFDIVGTDSASADADILLTAASAMRALEVGEFKLRINHRMLFNRFLDRLGASEKSVEILRTVDKREKIGDEATASMLAELVSSEAAREILEFIRQEKDFTATLEKTIEGSRLLIVGNEVVFCTSFQSPLLCLGQSARAQNKGPHTAIKNLFSIDVSGHSRASSREACWRTCSSVPHSRFSRRESTRRIYWLKAPAAALVPREVPAPCSGCTKSARGICFFSA